MPALKAPLTPAMLRVEIVCGGCVVLPRPAALSKVNPAVAAPKLTPVTRAPLPSKRLTWSPPEPSPTPEPLKPRCKQLV